MNTLQVLGCTILGAGFGGVAGIWAGFVADRGSDFPMAPVFYGPMGALCGAIGGAAFGAAVFT